MVTASGHAAFWKFPDNFTTKDLMILDVKNTKLTNVSAIYWHNVMNGAGESGLLSFVFFLFSR